MKPAIVLDELPAAAPSFIRNHLENLSPDTICYYRLGRAYYSDKGTVLNPLIHTKVHDLVERLSGKERLELDNNLCRNVPRSLAERQVVSYLKKCNVDVLLAEYGVTGVKHLHIFEKSGLPFVVHFHGYDAYRFDILEKYKKPYEEMFKKSAALVAVSKDMREQLISLGAPAEKVVYIPYGIDIDNFANANPRNAGPDFIFVGRFTLKKAPYLTLLAFAKVHDEIPEARLTMIGDDDLEYVCRHMARALKLEHAVTFTGRLGHEKIAGHMQRSRCYVQHSVTAITGDKEGTPLSISEASASGLPVVSTRHAGIKDTIVEGETGFLVDEDDVEGMARYMLQIARDPELAGSMGTAGRKRIIEHYSREESLQKLRNLLDDVSRKPSGQ